MSGYSRGGRSSGPLFQQRHYQTIAALFQGLATRGDVVPLADIVQAFANTFNSDNNNFKRDLFIAACQPGANVQARTAEGATKGKGNR